MQHFDGSRAITLLHAAAAAPAFIGIEDDRRLPLFLVWHQHVVTAYLCTPVAIEHLRSINRNTFESRAAKDFAQYRSNNLSFHLALAEIGGNPIIMLMVQSLLKLVDAIYPQALDSRKFVTALHRRHEAIIDALEAKDNARCEELMRLDAEATKMLKRAKVQRAKGKELALAVGPD
jgi:DNA-binding GntR family transcriptional regulator